jgi:hypothetical protein
VPSLLTLISTVSVGLATFSLAALGAMMGARLKRRHEEADIPARRARISKALLHYAMAGAAPPKLSLSSRLDQRLLIETALDAAHIMRGEARDRLVSYLQGIGLDRALQRQTRSSKLRDRLLAIEALRLFPGSKTSAALRAAERSSDLRIWLVALQTRTAIGSGPDTLGLLELAKRPGASRAQALHDLLAARAIENTHEALSALNAPLADSTRALLVRALGETGRYEAFKPLRVSLCHPAGQVRTAAAGALGALGFAAAREALAKATRDVDWRVRLKAVESIAKLGFKECRACLLALCSDPVWWVRFRAEEALRNLADAGVAELGQFQTVHSVREAKLSLKGGR